MKTLHTRSMFAAAVLCVLPSLVGAQVKEPARFLPFMAPQLEAARYSDADEEFAWVGWIGANVVLVEKGKWSGYLNANVETILGHRIRSFEAVQANYSLEVGAHREVGRGRLSPFFHHVSRHVQDREKVQAVDWNFLGVRYDSPWPSRWSRRGAFSGSFGVATLSSGVHYDYEARVAGDVDVVRTGNRAVFLLAALRHVGAEVTLSFPRESVTDVRVEAGVRRWTENSQFAVFVAYQRRADALISKALVTNQALFGFRIRGQRHEAPALAPLP